MGAAPSKNGFPTGPPAPLCSRSSKVSPAVTENDVTTTSTASTTQRQRALTVPTVVVYSKDEDTEEDCRRGLAEKSDLKKSEKSCQSVDGEGEERGDTSKMRCSLETSKRPDW